MKGYVDGIDWVNATAMKYWSIPSSYSEEKRKNEVTNAIFSNEYWGSLKCDGYYQRLIKDEDGNCFMISRNKNVNGEAVNKYDWVPQIHDFMEGLPNGTVLLSECYLPGNEGSKNITSLLGCLKDKCIERQEKGQKLHFYIFDICAFAGEDWSKKPAYDRFMAVNEHYGDFGANEYIHYAHYMNGEELWNSLQKYLSEGREGVVITHKDCPVYFKRTPAHKTIKVKKELKETIDCVIIGANPPTRDYGGDSIETWKYWENPVTHEKFEGQLYYKREVENLILEPITKAYYNGWAGSLKIGALKDGKMVQIGNLSGLDEELLNNWQLYIDTVIEVTAMEIMKDTYGIRHPRLVRTRPDLTPTDTDWYRIFG